MFHDVGYLRMSIEEMLVFLLQYHSLGECQCDSGVTAPTCPTRNNNPQIVISNFDGAPDAMPFPVIYGAALSTECGALSTGRSLVFKFV